jgi:hypothetical protein
MVANKGNLDEHPYNCEAYKNERKPKTKLHYATPLRLNMNSNIGAAISASGHRALWERALPARFSSYHTQATRASCLKEVIRNRINNFLCCSWCCRRYGLMLGGRQPISVT